MSRRGSGDGKGIEKHLEDSKARFEYAPDVAIKAHPIRFGSGSWTTATGVMTGTFTKRTPIGNGNEPRERFAVGMATIAHWNANGQLDHEYLLGTARTS